MVGKNLKKLLNISTQLLNISTQFLNFKIERLK